MAGMNEYCKQEGLNYSGGGGGGESRGLRRARPPRAAAVFLRGALKLALALGTLGAAGLELSEDLRPGAHHGVALLAGVLVVKTCVSIWEARG